MNVILAIFAGGGLGAVLRHYAVLAAARIFGETFPYGTLFVNVLGSLLIGILIEVMALKWQVSLETRAFLVTGFLGGFTTFSAFSLDVIKLSDAGNFLMAAIYVASSVFLSLLAVFAGTHFLRGIVG